MFYIHDGRQCFQLLFGFLLFPAQCLTEACARWPRGRSSPAVGVATGQDAYAVACSIRGTTSSSTRRIVVLKLGASLTAILAPCSYRLDVAFGAPFLGQYQEPIVATTLIGLAVVLVGFSLYESDGR